MKVEGDRGQNIGFISNIDIQSSDDMPFFGPDGRENFRKIIGKATDQERIILMTKIRDEARALHICKELANKRRLPILIVDADFQLDRNKLTFSYTSDRFACHAYALPHYSHAMSNLMSLFQLT